MGTMKVKLTSDQKNAKNLIVEWFLHTDDQVFVLSGYAGTGKTFLINHVIKDCLFLEPGVEAVFVTPTGKAATVLAQSGTVAGTVHSLIYIRNDEDFDVDENGEIIERDELSFYKRDKIDEKIRLIVIDEASMVNETVLNDLLSFGVKCLFCGDSAQLPPVNGECPLLITPHYTMKEIVRQAADNPIIQVATMARQGEIIPYGNYGDKVCVIPRHLFKGKERERLLQKADQVICGRNKTRTELNKEIRRYKGCGTVRNGFLRGSGGCQRKFVHCAEPVCRGILPGSADYAFCQCRQGHSQEENAAFVAMGSGLSADGHAAGDSGGLQLGAAACGADGVRRNP